MPAPAPATGPAPTVGSLAIPGYDSLSASQVVQRLDGLSGDELAAVRAYEEARRGRKTILSKISQLQDRVRFWMTPRSGDKADKAQLFTGRATFASATENPARIADTTARRPVA